MKDRPYSLKQVLKPYFILSVSGMLAFAPVSFMLRSLKNDIIALEYPINHFLSQCIRNGEAPYWLNTWGMGFPLQSNLTWGVFSTPQMLFSSLFDYNLYVLHFEFMFFVLLAGWGMFHLLHTYIIKNEKLALLLATCYMLSGFMVGSTQWLLYITAAAFIPLVISSLLRLLTRPSGWAAFQFAILYVLMCTSVYAAFNIITTYSLGFFIVGWLFFHSRRIENKAKLFKCLLLCGILTIVFCLPVLYYTIEVLGYMDRGESLSTTASFFNSNYVPPGSLSTTLFPFASVKMTYPNTEPTMFNAYMGIMIVLTLPIATWYAIRTKDRAGWLLLSAAILFLLISFGDQTPLRKLLNILPGFSYFRNPGIFRFYFILAIILFLAHTLRNKSLQEIFHPAALGAKKILVGTICLVSFLCLLTILINFRSVKPSFQSLDAMIASLSPGNTFLLSAAIQFGVITLIAFACRFRKTGFIQFILIADVVLNTLICTPFFSVSSYTLKEVQQILESKAGFPIQSRTPGNSEALFIDNRNNTWHNVNTFQKEVSMNESYRGPLSLTTEYIASEKINGIFKDLPLISVNNEFAPASVTVTRQRPTEILALSYTQSNTEVRLLQNYYPGWKAWYNNKRVAISFDPEKPGMSIRVPQGTGHIVFRYERNFMWICAMILHFIVICFFSISLVRFFRRLRSISPS